MSTARHDAWPRTLRGYPRPVSEPQHVYRRRRAAVLTGVAGAVVAAALLAGTGGDDEPPGQSASAQEEPPPPELPRGGRSVLPENRVVAYYGAPQSAELGALGIGTPDGAARRLARQAQGLRAPRPTGPARARADRRDRERRPGRGRHVPRPPGGQGDPQLPACRAAREGAAAARHPAGAVGLLHRGHAVGEMAQGARGRAGARPRVARLRGRGPGPGDRPRVLARGQRDIGVARAARRPRAAPPRSCS